MWKKDSKGFSLMKTTSKIGGRFLWNTNRVGNILFWVVMSFIGLPTEAHTIGREEIARHILD
jgi:hypothetical protein